MSIEKDLEKIQARLDGLKLEAQKKGGRFALLKAAQVVRNAAIENMKTADDSKTTNAIYKNIVVRFSSRLFKKSGGLGYRVGVLGGAKSPRTAHEQYYLERRRRKTGARSLESMGVLEGKGKDNPGGNTFYWRFLEFGTKYINERKLMQRALSQNTEKATNVFITEFNKKIDRMLKQAVKKGVKI